MKNIIFLFSLPRSGSTLLQKILMSNDRIASVSEPWLLLPLLYANKKGRQFSEYGSLLASEAINDLIAELPEKEVEYRRTVRDFSFSLYGRLCKNKEIYFLDKTPRYYFIIPEIAKIFPNAKFIFLFRNPLAVLASVCNTWHKEALEFATNYRDVFRGPDLLAEGFELLKNKSACLKYEKLLESPEKSIQNLCEYLEIDFQSRMLTAFKHSNLKGKMGDNVKNDAFIDKGCSERWLKFYNTALRQKFAKRYLDSIHPETLNISGYKKEEILKNFVKPDSNFTQSLKDVYGLLKTYARGKKFR